VAALLAVAIAVGALYVHRHAPATTPAAAPAASMASGDSALLPPPVQHPISVATAGSTVASDSPALGRSDGSDTSVRAALSALAGGQSLDGLLTSDYVIQRIVAAIDALPRKQLAPNVLPVRGAPGKLVTRTSGDAVVIDSGNAARYAPYMRVLEAVDPQQLVHWYARNYSLFQDAYRQLGYPDGYFNDRLVEVIDHLLATPEPTAPPALVRPKVMYEYADPALESLSAGQKMLLRAGPADEAQIKAKLRAIRAALTGAALPRTTASTAATPG
jgi:hypothetical protein